MKDLLLVDYVQSPSFALAVQKTGVPNYLQEIVQWGPNQERFWELLSTIHSTPSWEVLVMEELREV
jgi:hypothetical protein